MFDNIILPYTSNTSEGGRIESSVLLSLSASCLAIFIFFSAFPYDEKWKINHSILNDFSLKT